MDKKNKLARRAVFPRPLPHPLVLSAPVVAEKQVAVRLVPVGLEQQEAPTQLQPIKTQVPLKSYSTKLGFTAIPHRVRWVAQAMQEFILIRKQTDGFPSNQIG